MGTLLPRAHDDARRGSAQGEFPADLLNLGCLLFESRGKGGDFFPLFSISQLQLRNHRLLFSDFAILLFDFPMFFEKLVE